MGYNIFTPSTKTRWCMHGDYCAETRIELCLPAANGVIYNYSAASQRSRDLSVELTDRLTKWILAYIPLHRRSCVFEIKTSSINCSIINNTASLNTFKY